MKSKWKGVLVGGIIIILFLASFVFSPFFVLFLISIPILLSILFKKFIGTIIGGLIGVIFFFVSTFLFKGIADIVGKLNMFMCLLIGNKCNDPIGFIIMNLIVFVIIFSLMGLSIEILARKNEK